MKKEADFYFAQYFKNGLLIALISIFVGLISSSFVDLSITDESSNIIQSQEEIKEKTPETFTSSNPEGVDLILVTDENPKKNDSFVVEFYVDPRDCYEGSPCNLNGIDLQLDFKDANLTYNSFACKNGDVTCSPVYQGEGELYPYIKQSFFVNPGKTIDDKVLLATYTFVKNNDEGLSLDFNKSNTLVALKEYTKSKIKNFKTFFDNNYVLKITLLGVNEDDLTIPVDVEVEDASTGEEITTFENVPFSSSDETVEVDSHDLSVFTGEIDLDVIEYLPDQVNFILNGEKHVPVKWTYMNLFDTDLITEFDLTEKPLLPGDIDRDGGIDTDDIEYIDSVASKLFSRQSTTEKNKADLNYDGKVSITDRSLMIKAMSEATYSDY
ncbi:hypothetical protein GYA19_04780 [Candidatus Beckwithbacteria bacterium]|nr:hypothetical protein [Candidatus Beckwithbacteria bacterium]